MFLKSLTVIAALTFAFNAHANLEIAGIAQMAKTSYSASDVGGVDYKGKNDMRIGALLFLPLLPTLSLRTGLLTTERTTDIESAAGGFTAKDKLTLIPLNLQWNLPVTSLFIFGGITLINTQSSSISNCSGAADCSVSVSKTPNDSAVNLGLGYNIVSFALFRWALEVEYQNGSKDLIDGAGELKASSLNLGTVLAFGF